MNRLTRLQICNFRCLADVTVETRNLNVLFGPNGAGKSTFLDTVWFVRDCAIRGVDIASSERSHGIGALWDGADEGAHISISLGTDMARYDVLLGYSSGRIEPFAGERLYCHERERNLIDRKIGSNQAEFYNPGVDQSVLIELREPERLALSRHADFYPDRTAASEVDRLLRFVRFYHSRDADLYGLKKRGSESNHHTYVWERGQNLWSVLRNLHDKRDYDERYGTIMDFMRRAFPGFGGVMIEQTGPGSVYGSFVERRRRQPIQASGVSDGHIQLLIHLTALFSEGPRRDSVVLFDEPEISLHPHAITVFAEAAKLASSEWSKQVFIATHSPVLISQFDPSHILAVELDETGRTRMQRVSEIESIQDLLEEYATGSLYMAEMIAAQSRQADADQEDGNGEQ